MANNGTHFDGPLLGTDRGPLSDLPTMQNTGIRSQAGMFYFNDFIRLDDYNDPDDFSLAQIDTGGSAALIGGLTVPPGVLRLDCTANKGPIVQFNSANSGASANVAASNPGAIASFGCRFSLRDADSTDVFIGLAGHNLLDATVMDATGALTGDNYCGFHVLDADNGAFRFTTLGSGGTATSVENVFTAADDTYVEVAVQVWSPGKYTAYVRKGDDLAKVAGFGETLDPWDSALFPTFAAVGGGINDDVDIDFFWLANNRVY